jgi:hypothetical protein
MSAEARYSVVSNPWLKLDALLDLRDELGGDRFARLVMDEVVLDHAVGRQPVLEQLRLELGVVADPAVLARVLDVRAEVVKRVAELVKQRLGVRPGDENRLARALPLMKFELFEPSTVSFPSNVECDSVGRRPRARSLSLPRESIEVPEPDVRSRSPCRSPRRPSRRDGRREPFHPGTGANVIPKTSRAPCASRRPACRAAGTVSPRRNRGRTSPCAPSRRSSGSPTARS